MFGRFFLDHPHSVGETYPEHMRTALSFSLAMFAGAIACLVHGLVPAFFTRTGSGIIVRLHRQMVLHRSLGTEARRVDQTPPVAAK